jgi:hypothetical protein
MRRDEQLFGDGADTGRLRAGMPEAAAAASLKARKRRNSYRNAAIAPYWPADRLPSGSAAGVRVSSGGLEICRDTIYMARILTEDDG